jgi:hypothetical protein
MRREIVSEMFRTALSSNHCESEAALNAVQQYWCCGAQWQALDSAL